MAAMQHRKKCCSMERKPTSELAANGSPCETSRTKHIQQQLQRSLDELPNYLGRYANKYMQRLAKPLRPDRFLLYGSDAAI